MTSIVKLPDNVFEDAIVESIIFEFRKNFHQKSIKTIVYPKNEKITYVEDSKAIWVEKKDWKRDSSWNYNIYVTPEQLKILKIISCDSEELGSIADFTLGITPYDKYQGHSQEIIKTRAFHSNIKIDETYKPLISGTNIQRYIVSNEITEYIRYGEWLGAPREERFFTEPRILIRQIVSGQPPRIYAGLH